MEYNGTSITQTLKCPEQRGVPTSEASVSEGRMSPRAECPPGHLALGHNVPPDIPP